MLTHGILMTDASGEEFFQVADKTIGLLQLNRPLEKTELELLQIQQYKKIAQKQHPYLDFEIEKQGDRPDFIIRRKEKSIGLDAAAFAFTDRRAAFAQFKEIKEKFRLNYRQGRLRQCRGIEIHLTINAQLLPHPKRLMTPISELTEAFEKLEIDKKAWRSVDGPKWVMGEVPNGETGHSSDGSINWHVAGQPSTDNSFVRECGFNIEHQYLETVTAAEVKQRLDEIIDKHDKAGQGIDELVIIAGGPDKYGDAVSDESMMAAIFIDHWKGVVDRPKRIDRVVLVNWGSEKLHLLHDNLSK